MGPVIILDKSTLQSLSINEIFILNKYFCVNIPPVLLIEILGDLKKESTRQTPEEVVSLLAYKLQPSDSAINTHWQKCIEASLLGKDVKMERQILLIGGATVKNEEGEEGIIMDVPPEEKALCHWKSSEFTEAEKVLAARWRESTKTIDLEGFQRFLKEQYDASPKFSNLDEIKIYIDELLTDIKSPLDFLILLVTEFCLPQAFSTKVFARWELEHFNDIETFAPYAFYCFKVNLFFQLGLANGLIGTRPTNRVDLEYLYYFPFCRIFSSNDNFHKSISPLFIEEDQSFIPGEELKADLHEISEHWYSIDKKGQENWNSKWGSAPPEHPDSIVSKLWSKYMSRKKSQGNFAQNLSSEQSKKLVDEIRNKLKGVKSDTEINSDKAGFFARKRTLSAEDFCPCQSGKQFKDCCWEKVTKKK